MHADEKLIEAVGDHIGKHIGESEVFHEMISGEVHVDVFHVFPNEKYNFHTLVTCGMAQKAMPAPDDMKQFEYAELMLCLPPEWPMTIEAFLADQSAYWPIELLKYFARFPSQTNAFVTIGHTIDNSVGPFSASFFFTPVLFPEEFRSFQMPDGRLVNILSVIPIHAVELEYIKDTGCYEFIDILEQNGISEYVDPNREPTIKSEPL